MLNLLDFVARGTPTNMHWTVLSCCLHELLGPVMSYRFRFLRTLSPTWIGYLCSTQNRRDFLSFSTNPTPTRAWEEKEPEECRTAVSHKRIQTSTYSPPSTSTSWRSLRSNWGRATNNIFNICSEMRWMKKNTPTGHHRDGWRARAACFKAPTLLMALILLSSFAGWKSRLSHISPSGLARPMEYGMLLKKENTQRARGKLRDF